MADFFDKIQKRIKEMQKIEWFILLQFVGAGMIFFGFLLLVFGASTAVALVFVFLGLFCAIPAAFTLIKFRLSERKRRKEEREVLNTLNDNTY